MALRVVSLVPSITENLIQFGLVPIGRTQFCIEPKEIVKEIPMIGGTKTPKIEKIMSLKPDLVIANQEENRKEDVEALEKLGLKVWITYPRSVLQGLEFMREMIERLQLDSKHLKTVEKCASIYQSVLSQKTKNTPKVAALIWKKPWMVAGGDTYMNDMIKVAGGNNPFESLGRYPKVTQEDLISLSPDILLLPSEPYPFKEKDRVEWGTQLKASGLPTKVVLFSGEDLSWFGPRMERGLKQLSSVLNS